MQPYDIYSESADLLDNHIMIRCRLEQYAFGKINCYSLSIWNDVQIAEHFLLINTSIQIQSTVASFALLHHTPFDLLNSSLD